MLGLRVIICGWETEQHYAWNITENIDLSRSAI